jgi:hypothetical protein
LALERMERMETENTNRIAELANGFYLDCDRDGRTPNDKNLRAWLWMTCPAQFRAEVDEAIVADDRWEATPTA